MEFNFEEEFHTLVLYEQIWANFFATYLFDIVQSQYLLCREHTMKTAHWNLKNKAGREEKRRDLHKHGDDRVGLDTSRVL